MAENYNAQIESTFEEIAQNISLGVRSRGMSAANELRKSSQMVLRGQRSGRRYRKPGTSQYYTASAPGEPPAPRTGTFRRGWQLRQEITSGAGSEVSVRSYIENRIRTDTDTDTDNGHLLGAILEYGGGRIAPRPYKEKIQEHAMERIRQIYREPYM